jgi:hypothetical protein
MAMEGFRSICVVATYQRLTSGSGKRVMDSCLLGEEKSRFHTSTWRYERLLVGEYWKKCKDIPISTDA